MSELQQKEREVKISSLKHNILEAELNVLKKQQEIARIEKTIASFNLKLQELQQEGEK